jgi:hemolysin activation/secretion protein
MRRCVLIWILAQPCYSQNAQHTVDLSKNAPTADTIQRRDIVNNSEEVLIPSLLGLSIAKLENTALSGQKNNGNKILIQDFSEVEIAALEQSLSPFLQHPVSLATLDLISKKIEQTLDPSNKQLLTASYPGQEITSGVIAITVGTPVVQRVMVKGNIRYGEKFLSRAILTRPGSNDLAASLRKDLAFLNQNSFRKASVILSPSSDHPQLTDAVFRIDEKKPWNVFTGFDNYASKDLGDERFYIGGKFGNLFNLDHRLSWLLLSSIDHNQLRAANLAYQIPLDRHILLNFSLSESTSETSSTGNIDNNGEFYGFKANLQFPLADVGPIESFLKTGFYWRDNTYTQNGALLLDETHINLFQWETTWDATIYDSAGQTHLELGLSINPGEGMFSSSDKTYRDLGGKDSSYCIASLEADRSWAFGKLGELFVRSEAQWSNQTLLSSDQFYATGYNHVRGYDESAIHYDHAAFLSAEWKMNAVKLPFFQSLQPLAFIDMAYLSDHQGDSTNLSSVGLGMRWNMKKYFTSRADLAFPLKEINREGHRPELHFSINKFW